MTPDYAAHLDLKVGVINVDIQKIDGLLLGTYSMVIAIFQVVHKLGRPRFFQKTFLLADISMKVVLGMPFLIFGNLDIQFAKKELTWRTYTTKKTLPNTWRVKIIDQKKFAKVALDENVRAFVIHIGSLKSRITIYLTRKV